jgi:hypothetical protein
MTSGVGRRDPAPGKFGQDLWFGIARHQHVLKPESLTSRFSDGRCGKSWTVAKKGGSDVDAFSDRPELA